MSDKKTIAEMLESIIRKIDAKFQEEEKQKQQQKDNQ